MAPDRQVHDRTDVLALHVERPALRNLAASERRRQRIPGRVAAAQPAEVDHVPGPPVAAVGEVVDEGGGDRGEVGGRTQDRRVVRVIRGAEEDRGRGRLDRGELGARLVAHRRVGQRVARFHLVAVHERHDRDRLAAGPVRADDERLVMGVVAVGVPPGALDGPAGERRRPWILRGDAVPGLARDVADVSPLGVEGPRRRLTRNRFRVGRGRTRGLREHGGGGHGGNSSTGLGFGCRRNRRSGASQGARAPIGMTDTPSGRR